MTNTLVAFANAYDVSFRTLSAGLSHNEVPLFRAMHKALVGLRCEFEVEEHHGSAHQVTFTGNGAYARTDARCELSDLMIVCFSSITRTARLTYLQAKSERATLQSVCRRKFSANLEQWFLLKERPLIAGVGKFKPPNDLLSSALLPSVGSFAFFYKDPTGSFQIYYAAANYMAPPKGRTYSQRYGKLQANGPCLVDTSGTHAECLAACGNRIFAEKLFQLEIGTPIDPSVNQAASTRNWLSDNLRVTIKQAQQAKIPSDLAEELLALLATNRNENSSASGFFGAKQLIIVKSNPESND